MVLYLKDYREALERLLSADQPDHSAIVSTFRDALFRWCDIQLWCEYLQYIADFLNLDDMINEFENAVTEVGVGFDSHVIWELYLDYLRANQLLEEAEKVLSRSKKLVNRRGEFSDKAMFEEYQYLLSFEDHLTDANSHLEYARAEMKRPQPNHPRIRFIFERAILLYPEAMTLWSEYLSFSAHSQKLPALFARALEIFPTNTSYLTGHLRALEKFAYIEDDVVRLFEEYLKRDITFNYKVELCLTFLGIVKRKSTDSSHVFQITEQVMSQIIDNRIHNFFVSLLVQANQTEVALKHWDAVMKTNAKSCSYWLNFASFCKFYYPEKCRNVFKRACAAVSDFPETLFTAWIDYELAHGNLQDLEQAEQRIAKQRQLIMSRGPSSQQSYKRSLESEDEEMSEAPKHQKTESQDHTVYVSNLDYSLTQGKLRAFMNTAFGNVKAVRLPRDQKSKEHNNRGFAYVDFSDSSSYERALSSDKIRLDGRPMFISKMHEKYDPKITTQRDPKTLYVSQLHHDTSVDDLTALFGGMAGFKEIRPLFAKSGRFRGCAYIEFDDSQSASAALSLDDSDLHGMKIRVQISDPSLARKPAQSSLLPTSLQRRQNQ